jgi:hypothetical protein
VRLAGVFLARPNPRRPHDRDAGRFRVPRRHVAQQPLDLPERHRLEVFGDQVDMSILKVERRGLDDVPRLPNVKTQTVGKDNPLAVKFVSCLARLRVRLL